MLDLLEVHQHFVGQRTHHVAPLFQLVMQINQLGQPFRVLRLLLYRSLHTLGQDARLFLKAAADTAVVLYTATQQQQCHRHIHSDGPRVLRRTRILRQHLNLFGQILQDIAVELVALQGHLFGIFDKFFACRLVTLRALLPAFFGNAQLVAHDAEHLIHFAGRQGRKFGQVLIQRVNLLDRLHLLTHGVTVTDQIEHLVQNRLYITDLTLDYRAQLLVYAAQQLAHIHFGRQPAKLQAIKQAIAYPPERAAAILWRTAQCTIQRLLHLLR